MITVSGWEVLLLTVEVTEAGWKVRVGAGFVLFAALLVQRVVYWLREDTGPKLTG